MPDLKAYTLMFPNEVAELRARLTDQENLIATMGIAIRAREEQLNRIDAWLTEHGYPGSTDTFGQSNTADRTVALLDSLSRDNRTAELTLLRRIVDKLAPAVQRKLDAGICMHDVLTLDQFKTVANLISALRGIQAMRYIKAIPELDDPSAGG